MNAPLPLHQNGVHAAAELAQLGARARARGESLLQLLTQEAGGDATLALQRLAAVLGLPVLTLAELEALEPAYERLPFAEAAQRGCLLLRTGAGLYRAVLCDPLAAGLRDMLEERAAGPLEVCLASSGDIAAYLARREETLRALDGFANEASPGSIEEAAVDLSLRNIGEDSSPVVRLVNSTLYDALRSGASDIHLESAARGLSIKYRIDGVLGTAGGIDGVQNAEQAISRIKVMAELDISERRIPQDGRFKVRASGREIDIRVSIMPSIHGEDAVLRILDKERLAGDMQGLRLEALGFDDATKSVIRRLAAEPYGMLLTTGPTGSGKTTTLYAAINEINHGRDKIVTIEDPVEYQLPGVLQIPVNDRKGLTFARGLRSILRHDPDKIMVGEIRDGETAQIAVQAALTGHLVLTTVHANNAFDVIGRFTHMGVDLYSLVAALNGVSAQRLVRVNCPECVREVAPPAEWLAAARPGDLARACFRAGAGCAHCRGTGFKGRRAIAEVLVLDDELREMIVGQESARRIKEVALARGTRLLRDVGMDLVLRGETSHEELNRVVR